MLWLNLVCKNHIHTADKATCSSVFAMHYQIFGQPETEQFDASQY